LRSRFDWPGSDGLCTFCGTLSAGHLCGRHHPNRLGQIATIEAFVRDLLPRGVGDARVELWRLRQAGGVGWVGRGFVLYVCIAFLFVTGYSHAFVCCCECLSSL
jgi:hypothetical protein